MKYCVNSLQSEIKDALDYATFIKEIISFSSVRNPAFLSIHGFSLLDFNNKCHPVIFTEYVDGCFLEEKIGNAKFFTNTQRYIIMAGIANGMKYLHSKNIIHKNLTPSSIVLDEHMYPHINYFPMQIADTNKYTAPETISRKEYSFESDVYSFSMIAYELLTSIRPFDKYKTSDYIQKVCHKGERPEIKHIENEIIRSLLIKCWSPEAKERPSFDYIFQEITKYQAMISFDSSVSDLIDNFASNSITIMRYLRSLLFSKESSLKKIRIGNKSEMTGSLADLKSKILTKPNPNVLCYSVKYDSNYFVEYYDDQTPIKELPPLLSIQIKPHIAYGYRICILCTKSKIEKQSNINNDFISIAICFIPNKGIDAFKQKIIDYLHLQTPLSIQPPDIYIYKNENLKNITKIEDIENKQTPLFVSWNSEQFDQIKKYIESHVLIQEGLNPNSITEMKNASSFFSQHSDNEKESTKPTKNDNYIESKQNVNEKKDAPSPNCSPATNKSCTSDSRIQSNSNGNSEEKTITIMNYLHSNLFDKLQATRFKIEGKTINSMFLSDLKPKILSNSNSNILCYSIKYDSKYFVEYYDDQTPIQDISPYINIQIISFQGIDYRICVLCDKSEIENQSMKINDCICFAIYFFSYHDLYFIKKRIIYYLYQDYPKSNELPDIYTHKENRFALISKTESIEDNKTPLFVSWSSEQFDQIKKNIVKHVSTQEGLNLMACTISQKGSNPIEKSKDELNKMKKSSSPLGKLGNQDHESMKPAGSFSNFESKQSTKDSKVILIIIILIIVILFIHF